MGNITYPNVGLGGLQGADNVSGTVPVFYAAPLEDFETIGKPIGTLESHTELSELVRIAEDHVFKTTKNFMPLYSTQGTGSMGYEGNEERDTSGGYTTFNFQHPGSKEEAAGFFRASPNNDWIVLVKLPDGKYRQVGSEDFPAEIFATHGTGELGGDRNAFTGKIKAFALGLMFYEGVVTTTPVS